MDLDTSHCHPFSVPLLPFPPFFPFLPSLLPLLRLPLLLLLPLPPPLPQVLSVEPARQRVYLTHKKTLVDSSLPVLSSYDQAKPGGVHHGFIRSTYTSSCIVEFFNHVKGKVYRSDLGYVRGGGLCQCAQVYLYLVVVDNE